MLTRAHVTIIVGLAAAVWGATLLSQGLPLTWQYIKPFAVTVSVVSAACVIFERWAWRWIIFKGWLVDVPHLQGTWSASLVSSWVDPKTGERLAPISAVMVIRQSFSTFSARLFTRESSSFFVAHKIVRQNDGVFQLFGVYQNTPDIALRGDRSEIHFGALMLEVRGDPALKLEGHYWTDRATKGSLTLSDRKSALATGYDG
jgi:hypothetical protein